MNITGSFHVESLASAEVIEMDATYFPYPWKIGQWRELNFSHHHLYGWRIGGILVGFALFSLVPRDDVAHLYKILIHPDYRGSGQTKDFWSNITSDLQKLMVSRVFLEVEARNLSAISFYKKVGFQVLNRKPDYYSNGEDALMMELTL